MRFLSTTLDGVWLIEFEPIADDRGSFMRLYCAEAFAEHGLNTAWPQWNLSRNRRRGTLRGMHYQADPHGETKLVQCVQGRLFDVAVGLLVPVPHEVAP